MIVTTEDFLARADSWRAEDPDPLTAAELKTFLAGAREGDTTAVRELRDRFSGHLSFGTAGLRAELGAGPMRMNRVVVAHAAFGLGQFLLENQHAGNTLSVVIGGDARTNSTVFARDTAEVLSGMGITALLIEDHVPTPVLAFAVRHFNADAGVMVTASHNPASDNGYKVYLGGEDGGSQIIPPADRDIHQSILNSYATQTYADISRGVDSLALIGPDILDRYIEATHTLLPGQDGVDRQALRVCYTPLHGVGRDIFLRLLEKAGFSPPVVVEKQADPDPAFPTVAFPNPEEPGALDLSFETATAHACDLVIAHDPDADRLAVAIPSPSTPAGWAMVSGNDLGVLLLTDIAERAKREGKQGALACSVVSTPMISRVAERNGLRFVVTPTGFKWISRPQGLIAGFEEAIGYLVNPATVRDKDGISAGLALIDLAHRLHARGLTLTDRLEEISETYGGWGSETISLRCENNQQVHALMETVRADTSAIIGPSQEVVMTDYLHEPPEGFPRTDLLEISFPNGGRMIIRPSGTEPKLKIYVDALGSDSQQATQRVHEIASTIRRHLATLLTGSDSA